MDGSTITGTQAREYVAAWMAHGPRGVNAARLRTDALSRQRGAAIRLRAAASGLCKARPALPAGACRPRTTRARSTSARPVAAHSGARSGSPSRPRHGEAA